MGCKYAICISLKQFYEGLQCATFAIHHTYMIIINATIPHHFECRQLIPFNCWWCSDHAASVYFNKPNQKKKEIISLQPDRVDLFLKSFHHHYYRLPLDSRGAILDVIITIKVQYHAPIYSFLKQKFTFFTHSKWEYNAFTHIYNTIKYIRARVLFRREWTLCVRVWPNT